jgi:two-component system chemotaxis response regulator CheY
MALRVLITEEDRMTLDLLREIFTRHGIFVRVIHDRAQAAGLLNQEKFDTVFASLGAQETRELDFIRQIRHSTFNAHTPVVVLSTQGGTEARQQAFDAGGTFFLPKPVNATIVNRLLRSTRGAMAEERRRFQRIPFSCDVTCTAEGQPIFGKSQDLSLEGLLFYGKGSLRRGLRVQISFLLEQEKPMIRARGIVVRVDEEGRAGIRFVPISAEDRQRVREFVTKEVEVM